MESVSTCLLLLVGNSAATTTSGLGVLTTDTQAEVVADTTVGFDLLQAFQVVTQLRVDVVRQELAALTVDNVALPVEEPRGDLELGRVLQNGNNALKLVRVELTGTLAKVDIGLLANNVGVSAANTLDLSEGVLHLDLAVNVGVEQTQDEGEVLRRVGGNERHVGRYVIVSLDGDESVKEKKYKRSH